MVCQGETVSLLLDWGITFQFPQGEPVKAKDAVLLKHELIGSMHSFSYRFNYDNFNADYAIILWPGTKELYLKVKSDSPFVRQVSFGSVEPTGSWRRLNVTRTSEAYGQPWHQKTIYDQARDLFYTVSLTPEVSNASAWTGNAGGVALSGFGKSVVLTFDAEYRPDSLGSYNPLEEQVRISVSPYLWDAVPPLTASPSIYREELGQIVFIDMWNNTLDWECKLRLLEKMGIGSGKLFCILQTWQTGGFDAINPDAIWLPEYPPFYPITALQSLSEQAKKLGRFGLRTNYVQLSHYSPSYLQGKAHYAKNASGNSRWNTSIWDLKGLALRQESEIKKCFQTNASFTDQLGTGANALAWTDWNPEITRIKGAPSMRGTIEQLGDFIKVIKEFCQGPISSESIIDQTLLGNNIDLGDYGIMDGYNRYLSPEYKLRYLQSQSAFHGMGIAYRYFENAPSSVS